MNDIKAALFNQMYDIAKERNRLSADFRFTREKYEFAVNSGNDYDADILYSDMRTIGNKNHEKYIVFETLYDLLLSLNLAGEYIRYEKNRRYINGFDSWTL